MLNSDRLIKTLSFLDAKYQEHLSSEDSEEAVVFAKLAVIEFCGWLEMSFDIIARKSVCVSLPNETDQTYLTEKIEKNYGFTYKTHTAPLLVHAMGLVKFIDIEKTLEEEGKLGQLKTIINKPLKKNRDKAAHTFLDGTQRNYDAPSLIIGQLMQLIPIMDRLTELCEETH